jgi:LysM repeat protein
MEYRSPVRMLAPIALIAAFAAVIVVAGTSGHRSGAGSVKTATAQAQQRHVGRRTYKVQPGDSLTSISERSHVPISTITRLNPHLDRDVIIPGRRIKLRS